MSFYKGEGRNRKLPKTISEEQFLEGVKALKLRSKATEERAKLALMLGFYQCMRVSEVVKLKPENVDRGRGYIHILKAKGNKDRDVPIMKPVARGLKLLPIGRDARTLERWANRFLGIKFHTLRHSGATYYLHVKKVDLRTLQQLLGHSSLDVTQIYTHVTPENMKNTFEEVWR